MSAGAVARSHMRARDVARVAAQGVRARPLRMVLSTLGIAIGVASLVAVVGIGASSRSDLLATLDRLGTNLLTVSPGEVMLGGTAVLPTTAEAMIGRVDGSASVSSVETLDATVRRSNYVSPAETGGIAVQATDLRLLETTAATLRSGAWLTAVTARYPVVVLGSTSARRLGIARWRPGLLVWIEGRWWSVGGVLDPVALAPELDSSALVGRPVAARLLAADSEPSAIYVRAEPGRIEAVRARIPASANPEHPEEVEVTRPSDAIEARAAADETLTALLLGLGGVSLLVGAIGIANVMVIGVLERRAEIGLRRALGATRRHVRVQFLTESILLAVAGGVTGALLGAGVTLAYASSRGWTPSLPPEAAAIALASALLVGGLAGIYPAARAARLSPTEALRGS